MFGHPKEYRTALSGNATVPMRNFNILQAGPQRRDYVIPLKCIIVQFIFLYFLTSEGKKYFIHIITLYTHVYVYMVRTTHANMYAY